MTVTMIVVLRHFLEQFRNYLENESDLSPVFKDFFTRSELMEILQWLYANNLEDFIRVDTMANAELLDFIHTDYQILGYYLSLWDSIRKNNEIQLGNDLEKICSPTHYLQSKPVKDWDQYDINNFRSLQRKAGRIQYVYGIYSSDVMPMDAYKVTTQPKRFYQTETLAEEALKELYSKNKPDLNLSASGGDYNIYRVLKST